MTIKVCGMRDPENIRAVEELHPDMMGLIFYPRSPRCVVDVASIAALPKRVKRIGVFVNAGAEEVCDCAKLLSLDGVQLHGDETPAFCERLRNELPDMLMLKALSINTEEDLARWEDYAEVVDLFLFDTKVPCRGGSGESFDWTVLEAYGGRVPFLLSGGIGPCDAEKIRGFRHPAFAGIDLNSKFETSPGVKDVELLGSFLREVRGYDTV